MEGNVSGGQVPRASLVPGRRNAMITMEELLALMVRQGGSDLHLSAASPPRIRVDGMLLPVEPARVSSSATLA